MCHCDTGRDTRSFRSADASGSTSQAANIQEALELGAGCLLLDEDVCATNFMIRDARMQARPPLLHPLHVCIPYTLWVSRLLWKVSV